MYTSVAPATITIVLALSYLDITLELVESDLFFTSNQNADHALPCVVSVWGENTINVTTYDYLPVQQGKFLWQST